MKPFNNLSGGGRCVTRVIAVTRHELRILFYSPLTCIFMAGLLASLSLCVFMVADFYATDEASMRTWQIFIPWIGLIFIPALAMRSWPDEYTDRSVELAMTLPIHAAELVVGKFLAGLTVIAVTLLFTLPFPITLAYLGEPDLGVVFTVWLAAFLLLALYLAISLMFAAILGEPVSVFVISVLVLFVMTIFGSSEFDSLLGNITSPTTLEWLNSLVPRTHFDALCSGLVTLSDLSYFLLLTTLALVVCSATVTFRRVGSLHREPLRMMRSVLPFAISFAVIQALAAGLPINLDLTEQKEFTLSDATLDELARAPDGTRVRLFWSASQGNVPTAIQSHARRTKNLLERLAWHSQGNLEIEEIDPAPDTDAELLAVRAGIQSVPMSSGDAFYLGMTIEYREQVKTLPYLDIQREHFLEYDLISSIHPVIREDSSRIALLGPLIPPGSLNNPRPGLSFVEELKRSHDLALVPFFDERLPEDVDVLIVVQSVILKKTMLQAIDRFVVEGGTLIVLMDPYVRSDQPSNELQFQPSAEINDISDLLLAWGLNYIGDRIAGDRELGTPVALSDDHSRVSFPYWMRFNQARMAPGFPATASINNLLLIEPGWFEIADDPPAGAIFTPLVSTTANSGSESRPAYATRTPSVLARDFEPDGRRRMVAALISGKIESAFQSSSPMPGDSPARQSQVFAIADVDWLFDQFALQTSQLGDHIMTRPTNDNLAFLGNLIATGSAGQLATIQARGPTSRPFSRVEQLFRDAQEEIRGSEQSTWQNVAELERQLAEIRAISGIDDLSTLPSPLKEQAITVQSELVAMRRDLRNIRLQIRQRIDQLGHRLTIINVLSGPLLVIVLAVFIRIRRQASR